jgi:hypothetical protein
MEMIKRNPELEIPFTSRGDLMHSIDPAQDSNADGPLEAPVWRANDSFTATLKLIGTQRGRSAAYFRWQDVATGAIYPMFLTDASRLMMIGRSIDEGGVATGSWYVVKRGHHYGITPDDTPAGVRAPSGADGGTQQA